MIKLVVSDIDGTLLKEGTDQINPEMFGAIRQMRARGILFAASSGRQYASMRHVFEPVANDMIFIAENGSNVMCRGKNMSCDYMDQSVAEELLQYLHEQGDYKIILSTPETMYLDTPDEGFYQMLTEGYHNKAERVENLLPYCSHTNKMAVYHLEKIEEFEAQLKEKFGDRLNVMIAGTYWVDFMNRSVDKGKAVETIQKIMKISKEETMAFGDNCNDIAMLLQSGESYAVANAHPQLKEIAKHIAPSYAEDGVLQVIKEKVFG